MSLWISWFIVGLLFNTSYISIFNKIHNCKKKLTIKDHLTNIIISFVESYTIYFNIGIRFIIMFICFFALFKLIFRREVGSTLVTTFIIQLIFAIGEMIFVVFSLSILHLNATFLTQSSIGILLTNISIVIIAILILKIKMVKQIINSIISWYKDQNILNLITTICIGVFTILFLLYQNLKGINNIFDFMLNNIFVAGISYFIVCFLIEKSSYNKIKDRYDTLIDYAKTYEQEVVEKSKWQHEYQNQLIIVKSKISKTNKEALQYIDNLLVNKPSNENTQWLHKLSTFPNIGLKGLLCYKIGQMQAKGIKVYVDVIGNCKIKKKQGEILEKNLQDISRLLGVYLDNAMDASLNSKQKYLILEVEYSNQAIIFSISNTYEGITDIQKIGEENFTTKGKGHGYGLSLAKDILAANSIFTQKKEINGMYYVQKLIIDTSNRKIKKKEG